jgi:hypothetical protein
MATPQQLRETSRILTKHAKDVRDDADRGSDPKRCDKLPLAPSCRATHATLIRRRQDER